MRVIFTLPETIRNWHPAPNAWATGYLAYVEWYRLSDQPDQAHNMYIVQRPRLLTNNIIEGDIIPLCSIRQSCQLIPLCGPGITWPTNWNSNNVLDESEVFLLNNWSSKYAYQTIW